MDKFEYKMRADEIKNLISQQKYKEAVEIADTIDWKNVKNSMMLCTVSDLYKACKRYEDSRAVLMLAYERNPGGRMILYSLCELSIKLGDMLSAVEFCKEYMQVAPKDVGRFILKYKIYTAQGVSMEERVQVLEELQECEMKEKWMYELAFLYHMLGFGEKCVDECNQIALYFGEGKYVIKALELKATHEPLSGEQDLLYKRLVGPDDADVLVKDIDVSKYNTIDLQKELANNLKEVLFDDTKARAALKEERAVEHTAVYEPVSVSPKEPSMGDTQMFTPGEVSEVIHVSESLAQEPFEPSHETPIDVAEPVVPFDMSAVAGKQAENVPKDNGDIREIGFDDVTASPAPTLEESAPVTDKEPAQPKIQESRGTMVIIPKSNLNKEAQKTSFDDMHKVLPKSASNPMIVFPNYDDMVSMEGDGQISLVVPEQEMVDKQITGQISIDDVLAEWEKMKLESEKKWRENVERRVLQQTGSILKDFDETSKVGLLEQLEDSINSSLSVELTEQERVALSKEEPGLAISIVDETSDETADAITDESATGVADADEIDDAIVTGENVIYDGETEVFYEIDGGELIVEEQVAEEQVVEEQVVEEPVVDEKFDDDDSQEKIEVAPYRFKPFGLDAAEPEEVSVSTDIKEIFVADAKESEEKSSEITEEVIDEPIEESEEEPTEEELSFDRTPFLEKEIEIEPQITENGPEPYAEDNTESIPQIDNLDYFMMFAEAGEERDREDREVIVDSGEDEVIKEPEPEAEPKEDVKPVFSKKAVYNTAKASQVTEEAFQTGSIPNTDTPAMVEEYIRTRNEALRPFNDDQVDRFEPFIQTESGRTQILEALKEISVKANTGNVIISAEDTDSAVELGISYISELSSRNQVSGKVAKIKASSLNAKDPESMLNKLYGGALIIIDAHELRRETLAVIRRVLNAKDKLLFVVFTTKRRMLRKFEIDNSDMLESFTVHTDIETLDNDSLVTYAKAYAYAKEYTIDEMGTLALHTRISERQTNSHNVLTTEVKELVDAAIANASRKNVGHLFKTLVGKRYDENDMIILREKDFE